MSELDERDRGILDALRANARLSNKQIAARVGIAESTCSERLRRLEKQGILRGYRADLDLRQLGVGLEALVTVRLRRHSFDDVAAFHGHAQTLPEIRAIFHMTGRTDFVLHVAVQDTNHLRSFALGSITSRPEVARIETALIYEHTENHALPRVVPSS